MAHKPTLRKYVADTIPTIVPGTMRPAPEQVVEPLAVMIGNIAREYVVPERRADAIDALYRLVEEARNGT